MRRVLALLLSLLVLLGLTACGESAEGVGRYVCVELLSGELPLAVPDSTLLLDRGGYARLELDQEGGAAIWELQGENLRLTVNGKAYEGSLQDGFVRLAVENDLTIVYIREDLAEGYRAAREEELVHRSALQSDWAGDWYGFWTVDEAKGRLADGWYDCCARIRATPDGWLTLLLWDEDSSAEKPIAYGKMLPEDGGTASVLDGWFWFASAQDAGLRLHLEDGCLRCEGVHEGDGERFSFTLALRRWGESWDADEQTPYYYESWYLPLVRAGESLPDRMTVSK